MAVNQHSSDVIQEITNDVLRIVISRPEKRNPLGSSTARALVDALKRADQDNDIRVIVLTGAGDAFSAGGNLQEFVELFEGSASEIWEDGATWHDLYGCIRKLGKPVIARVDGPAIAGGCGLVCCCDFVIASERAIFGLPEITIGLFALFILPPLLDRVGRAQARKLTLTGRRLTAREALEAGIVDEVAPIDSLDDTVERLAGSLSKIAPATMRKAKHSFRVISDNGFDAGLELARGLRGAFMGSRELHAGIRKFFEGKRS
ncbi:MAG: enoyl-CoA hydratase-related protein [Gammaproteobacteria bacterium]|nr:enoyl-CoA hydratase-related protein [Gammaproteobacteria bacterium]MDE0413586.1 enoyl-CoA hydratase-related protein [Gammaproteobacteria bacterium]